MHAAPRPSLQTALIALAAAALIACGGAVGKAIDRGDQYYEAGQYDDAAKAYEEALKLDPKSDEARIKLEKARSKQAGERLARAEALEARGELIPALRLVQEAVSLDPNHAPSQQALTRISNTAVDKAQQLSGAGKLREAFELVSLVLRGSPNHPRATTMDGELRDALAAEAFDKALAHMEREKLGNALVQLAACLGYRPDHAEARLRFGQVKLQLEEDLRFWVVIGGLRGEGRSAAVAKAVDPTLLQEAFDERLLVQVAKAAPADEQPSGISVNATFDGYDFQRGQQAIQRSCDYVCGTDYKPNPDIERLRQELAGLDSQLSTYDSRISDLERRYNEAQKDLSQEQADADRKRADLDEARARLSECQAEHSGDTSSSNPCWSEESNVRSKQSSYDSAQRDVDSARRDVDSALDNLQREKTSRESTRQSRANTNQRLLNTPEQVAVDKYCPFNYAVQQHQTRSEVLLKLSMTRLDDASVILGDEPFKYQAEAEDMTHRAHPGRCPEVAQSDPLDLPNEGQLRADLVKQVIADLRKKVLASYDAYRSGFLAAARRSETSGLTEEATESYVRYILTAPNQIESAAQIQKFFKKTAGLGKLEGLWTL